MLVDACTDLPPMNKGVGSQLTFSECTLIDTVTKDPAEVEVIDGEMVICDPTILDPSSKSSSSLVTD